MPIATHDTDTLDIRRGGKRIYIVKDPGQDQPVVRTVPVGVCAAPPRIALNGETGGGHGPTCPAPIPAHLAARHGLADRVQRVREVVLHPRGTRFGR